MISNPVLEHITGNLTEEFVYEGGSTLFHFSPNDNNLSKYMDCNIVFFANSEEHGLDVLKRMFEFKITCKAKYIQHNNSEKSIHWEEFVKRAENKLKEVKSYLDAINNNKVKLSLAPTNQMFIVGWAQNDTI